MSEAPLQVLTGMYDAQRRHPPQRQRVSGLDQGQVPRRTCRSAENPMRSSGIAPGARTIGARTIHYSVSSTTVRVQRRLSSPHGRLNRIA